MASARVIRTVSRRSVLKAGLLATALPLLAACSSPPAAAPTTAPAAAPSPTTAAAAAPTNTAAAPTAAPAAATPATGAATGMTPTAAAAAQAPVTITGSLQIIQERGFNPLQTEYIDKLLVSTAQQKNWPLEKTYADAFTGGSDFFQKMAAVVAAGNSPDLYFGSQDTFQLWNQGSLVPVDDTVTWAIQQFGAVAPLMKLSHFVGNHWYAIPYFTTTGGYWVRKSWFDAINFDITGQHTLQEWLDACVAVSDPTKKRWGWGNTVNRSGDGSTNVYSPLWQSGARVTTADNKVAFNSPEAIAAYDWLKDLYTNPKYAKALPPGVNSWTDPSNNEAYLAGTIGFSSNAGTMFATAMVKAPQVAADTHLIPHPSGSVGQKQALIVAGPGSYHFQIFKGAKNAPAASAMVQILLSQDNQRNVWKNSPGHSTPAYTWGWDDPVFNAVPNNVVGVSKDIILSDKVFKLFEPLDQPRLWINAFDSQVVATDTMADVLRGTATKDAVANATTKIQAIYDKFQGK